MEDTRSLSEVPGCELLLDHYVVSGKEPIEGIVEFHFSASVSESSSARVVVCEPRRGQLGCGVDEALRHHGDDEIPLSAPLGGKERIEADPTDGPEDRLPRAMGEGLIV